MVVGYDSFIYGQIDLHFKGEKSVDIRRNDNNCSLPSFFRWEVREEFITKLSCIMFPYRYVFM